MTTDQFPFKVLFCFEDAFKLITEIKRTDIQSEDKSLVYKWLIVQKENESKVDLQSLRIEKQNENITPLTFKSMDQRDGEQIRNFAEGVLAWNAENVLFNDKEMDRVDPELINPKWLQLIAEFLI